MKRYVNNRWAAILMVFIWMLSPVITYEAQAASFSGKAYFVTEPGAPAGIDLTPNSPQTVNAGGQIAFSTTVTDKYGNSISDQTGLTYWVEAGTGNGTIDQNGLFTATTVGQCTVHAKINGLADSTVVNINPGQVSAQNSTVTASTNQVVADGVATATITVTLRDSYNNPVPGKTVSLSSSATVVISGLTNPTDASGRVTAQISSTVAGLKTISARDETDSIDIADTEDVTFIAGPLDHITIASVSTEQVAGTAFTLIATAYDANNNVVNLNDAATIQDNTGTISPTSATFVAGVLTVPVTVTLAGSSNTIKVTVNGTSGSSNSFTVYANVPSAVSFNPASTYHVACDTKFTYTATFVDTYGNNVGLTYHPWGTPTTVDWSINYGSIVKLSNQLQAEVTPDTVAGRLHEVTATLNW